MQIVKIEKSVGVLPRMLFICFTATMLVAGCGGSYGKLRQDSGLTKAFRSLELLPDYSYYYTGRLNLPDAVMGIKPGYTLKSELWHPVGTRAEVLQLASRILLKDFGRAQGAVILDHQGNKAGIWFSTYTSTTVKMMTDRNIIVYSPYSPSDLPVFPGISDD